MFAKNAAGGVDFNIVDQSLNNLMSYIRGVKGKSQDDIDAAEKLLDMQRKTAMQIYNVVQSTAFRQALKDNEIEYGSEQAHKLASLINLFGGH